MLHVEFEYLPNIYEKKEMSTSPARHNYLSCIDMLVLFDRLVVF